MSDSSGGTPIPTEQLAAPARRALASAGYTLEGLAESDETSIEDLHGVGPTALKTLRATLKAHGLSFEEVE